MKKILMKTTTLIFTLAVMLPLTSCAQSHARKKSQPSAKEIYQYTKDFITKKLNTGTFKVYDNVSNRSLDLKKVTDIRSVRCSLGDKQYYTCATFDADDGNNYDIDFFMHWNGTNLETNHILLHKTNSKPRWVWYENPDTGIWKALAVCGVDQSKKLDDEAKKLIDSYAAPIVFDQNDKPLYVWFKDKADAEWKALKVCDTENPKVAKLYKSAQNN